MVMRRHPEENRMTDDAPFRILVPLDGTPQSQQALPYAQALATSSTSVVLLEVLPDPEPERGLLGNVTKSAEAVGQRRARVATTALETIAERVRQDTPAVAVEVAVVAGGSADQILQVARSKRVDLIVMATYSRSQISRLVLGSVTDRIVKSADIPVLVVRPQDAIGNHSSAPLHRLVVPLDGSPVAATALLITERLAHLTGLPVHLVTVADGHQGEAKFRIKRHYTDLVERDVRVTEETLTGEPADAIAKATRPGDLIVMASHHRAGMRALLHHGVAERLISHGRCPVLLTPDAPQRRSPS
jgi:nucleotide-binding universal stress UspA family protein